MYGNIYYLSFDICFKYGRRCKNAKHLQDARLLPSFRAPSAHMCASKLIKNLTSDEVDRVDLGEVEAMAPKENPSFMHAPKAQ